MKTLATIALLVALQSVPVHTITGPATATLSVNPDGTAKTPLVHYWKLRQDGVQIAPRQATWTITPVSGNVTATISIGGMVTYKAATTTTARVRVNAVYLGQTLTGYTDLKVSGLATTPTPTPTPTPAPIPDGEYQSSLGANGLTPDPFLWQGRKWRAYVRSDDVSLPYPLRYTSNRVRFELRPDDMADTSRAELGGSYADYPRLPNGKILWGAFSTRISGTNTTGGVHTQIHMGSKAGGSPAFAFRTSSDGPSIIKLTTNSQSGSGTTGSKTRAVLTNVTRGVVHDFVYRMKLDPYHGSLTVWHNRVKVLDLPDVPLGHSNAEHYMNFGAYYSGGIKSTVVAEYSNVVYPSTVDLSARTTATPVW
jgi:hypothetical protein